MQRLLHGVSAAALAVLILAASAYTYLFLSQEKSDFETKAATTCTVDAKLVNSCRPWIAAAVGSYTMAGDAYTASIQFPFFEKRLNNPNVLTNPTAATTITKQLDFVHFYNTPTENALKASQLTYVNRTNTYLQLNWKPDASWALAGGSNAAVNTRIDGMANSIKAVSPKKIMLSIYHEPEDNVSVGTAGSGCTTKGSAGSPTDYINMWRNVRARFDALGVTNVVWNMNYMGYSGWNCLVNQMWPGNNYVDWVTWDPYAGDTASFASSVQPFYNFLTTNSDANHNYLSKVWGFSEFGYWNQSGNSTEAQAPIYWQQVKAAIQNNTFPKIKLYSAFDTGAASSTADASLIGLAFNATVTPNIAEQTAYNDFANTVFALGQVTTPPPPPPPPPPPSDTTKPVTSISSPAGGTTAKNSLTVTGAATDNVAVTKVELLVDGAVKATDSTAPFASFSWDTKTVADGARSLTLKAYDAAGNTGVSSAVNITVSNTTPPPAPIISSLTASPSTITAGARSTLSWVTQNVSSCNVTPDGTSGITATSWQTPILTTVGTKTYTLTCYNPAVVSISKNVSITVNAAPTPPSKPTFTADKTTIQTGGTVNFGWSSAGATSCVFNPGNVGGAATVNSKSVINITATTTYSLSCSNAVGTTQATPITITVSAAPVVVAPPVITSFVATPSSITYGATSTLSWKSTGVISAGCRLNPGSTQEPNGSITTGALVASTSYTLTCSNPDGKTTSASVSIIVGGKPAQAAPPAVASTVNATVATQQKVTNTQTGAQVTNVSVDDTVAGLASLDISNVVDTTKEQSITYVEYYDGEKLIQKVDKAPFALDTKLLKNGSYTITERTYYLDGSKSEVTKVLGVENLAPEVQGAEAGTPMQKNPATYALLALPLALAAVSFVYRRRWMPVAQTLAANTRQHFARPPQSPKPVDPADIPTVFYPDPDTETKNETK